MTMTAQEVFDTAVTGVINQGGPALAMATRSCRFRGDNGRKCAVGWLISDEDYDPRMESFTFPTLLEAYPETLRDLVPHQKLLKELQLSHDAMLDDSELRWFKEICARIADKFGLDPSVIK